MRLTIHEIANFTSSVNEDGTIEEESQDKECEETIGKACYSGVSFGATVTTLPGGQVSTKTTATATISTCATVTECNPRNTNTATTTTSIDACDATDNAAAGAQGLKPRVPPANCVAMPAIIWPEDPFNTANLRLTLNNYKSKADPATPFEFIVVGAPAAQNPSPDPAKPGDGNGYTAFFWVAGITKQQKAYLKTRGVSCPEPLVTSSSRMTSTEHVCSEQAGRIQDLRSGAPPGSPGPVPRWLKPVVRHVKPQDHDHGTFDAENHVNDTSSYQLPRSLEKRAGTTARYNSNGWALSQISSYPPPGKNWFNWSWSWAVSMSNPDNKAPVYYFHESSGKDQRIYVIEDNFDRGHSVSHTLAG